MFLLGWVGYGMAGFGFVLFGNLHTPSYGWWRGVYALGSAAAFIDWLGWVGSGFLLCVGFGKLKKSLF